MELLIFLVIYLVGVFIALIGIAYINARCDDNPEIEIVFLYYLGFLL